MRPSLAPIALTALALAACSPTWESTGTGNPESEVIEFEPAALPEGVPDAVGAFLPDELLASLISVGMPIYGGDDPPNVEGMYLLDTLVIDYDDVPAMEGVPLVPVYLGLIDQEPDGSIDGTIEDDGSAGAGSGAFISGAEDCFTVYVDISGYVSEDECTTSSPHILSACLVDGGIEDVVLGYVMVSTDGPCDATVPEGHRRLMTEGDHFGEEIVPS